ncbi:MAG: DUF2243 domain-containing protein [Deltaproteobacteria bacterium]|nr:DUF2243 domain-containing protein [Deltaproteobacteria bacterium]
MAEKQQQGPLICAGVLIGAGLGGFVDGILFHQILQWHHMLSTLIPADNLVNIKVNMFWDGIFHAAVWIMTAMGLVFLWHAGQRRDVCWSGRTFLGSLMAGWGLFNIVEGLIDHQFLGLHHVYEYSDNKIPWDIGFLVFGIVMLLEGWSLISQGRKDAIGKEVKNEIQ